ncbi:MAG: hypothetical protein ACTSRS_16580 [Candidatus Helarchaeota archaeon]
MEENFKIRMKKKSRVFKTNIIIKDPELWNWFKYESRQKGFKGVSDFITFLINTEKNDETFNKILLKELEKYYEFSSYSYKDIAVVLNINLDIILDFMEKFNLKIIKMEDFFKNYRKNVDTIHDLMFDKGVLPREIKIGKTLSHLFGKYRTITSRDLLDILFENPCLKRREVFNLISLILTDINFNTIDFQSCENSEAVQKYSQNEIINIFYENGIEIDEEDLEIDAYYLKLRDLNAEFFYGTVVNLSIYTLIKNQLLEIKYLIENGISYEIEREDFLKRRIEDYIMHHIDLILKKSKQKLLNYNFSMHNFRNLVIDR